VRSKGIKGGGSQIHIPRLPETDPDLQKKKKDNTKKAEKRKKVSKKSRQKRFIGQ